MKKYKYIRVSTYAKMIGITAMGVRAKIKRGELPFKRIDGVLFVKLKTEK